MPHNHGNLRVLQECHSTPAKNSSKKETRPEKESKLPKETKEAVEETAVADTTSLGLNSGDQ